MTLVKFVQGPYLCSYPLKLLTAINRSCSLCIFFLLVEVGLIWNYVFLLLSKIEGNNITLIILPGKFLGSMFDYSWSSLMIMIHCVQDKQILRLRLVKQTKSMWQKPKQTFQIFTRQDHIKTNHFAIWASGGRCTFYASVIKAELKVRPLQGRRNPLANRPS